jgi:hypothetical protein
MQDIREVLRVKEQLLDQLQREIEALRFSIKILEEEEKEESFPRKMGSLGIVQTQSKDNGTRPLSASLKQFP